jgi:hypothetical protein
LWSKEKSLAPAENLERIAHALSRLYQTENTTRSEYQLALSGQGQAVTAACVGFCRDGLIFSYYTKLLFVEVTYRRLPTQVILCKYVVLCFQDLKRWGCGTLLSSVIKLSTSGIYVTSVLLQLQLYYSAACIS